MNGNRNAAVASLVPLGDADMTIAPTQVSRRPRRAAAHDPTRVERRRKLDIDELPTLVVPPPITLSSGSRRRPKEIVDEVASSFDISPFESFEGDVETIADVAGDLDIDDDSREQVAAMENAKDESAFACMLPPMAQVWNQADARAAIDAEPVFSIDIATNVDDVELIAAIEDDASESRAPRRARARWIAAFVVAAAACVAGALVIDARVSAEGRGVAQAPGPSHVKPIEQVGSSSSP